MTNNILIEINKFVCWFSPAFYLVFLLLQSEQTHKEKEKREIMHS